MPRCKRRRYKRYCDDKNETSNNQKKRVNNVTYVTKTKTLKYVCWLVGLDCREEGVPSKGKKGRKSNRWGQYSLQFVLLEVGCIPCRIMENLAQCCFL